MIVHHHLYRDAILILLFSSNATKPSYVPDMPSVSFLEVTAATGKNPGVRWSSSVNVRPGRQTEIKPEHHRN